MPLIEQLESRQLFASFTAASVADLIADMNAANAAGGSNTITLTAGSTFKLSAVDNSINGPNGLPAIAAGDDLTIIGNGDTIQRTSGGTPAFRLFSVTTGGSLALTNVSLSGGLASGGAAIFNQGTLSLNRVNIQYCTAQAPAGLNATGGAIFSSGVLTISDTTIQNNQALGGDSGAFEGGAGATGAGGGIYIAGGSASVMNSTLSSNLARGGNGGNGGKAFFPTPPGPGGAGLGGAIYVATGTLQISGTTITHNTARGGSSGRSPKGIGKASDGIGQGGGIYIASSASVTLDAFTQTNTSGNTASTSDNDIFGSFTLLA